MENGKLKLTELVKCVNILIHYGSFFGKPHTNTTHLHNKTMTRWGSTKLGIMTRWGLWGGGLNPPCYSTAPRHVVSSLQGLTQHLIQWKQSAGQE